MRTVDQYKVIFYALRPRLCTRLDPAATLFYGIVLVTPKVEVLVAWGLFSQEMLNSRSGWENDNTFFVFELPEGLHDMWATCASVRQLRHFRAILATCPSEGLTQALLKNEAMYGERVGAVREPPYGWLDEKDFHSLSVSLSTVAAASSIDGGFVASLYSAMRR